MNSLIQDILLKNATFGYSYDKILLDKGGTPRDYLFLDTNSVFDEMLGFKPGTVKGKCVSEIAPKVLDDPIDWVQCFGAVALTGKSNEFEAFSEALQKWFHLSVFSRRENTSSSFRSISRVRKKWSWSW